MPIASKNSDSCTPFLPTGARIAAILQLCIAFSTLLWVLLSPFTYDLYVHKTKLAPLRFLLEDKDHYSKLSLTDQFMIRSLYQDEVKVGQKEGLEKTIKSLRSLFSDSTLTFQAWLLLSFILPIFLLKRIDGAKAAFWLLPFLFAVFATESWPSISTQSNAFDSLVPSESELAKKYLSRPIEGTLSEQMEQLKLAFDNFLLANFGKDLDEANYNFQWALIKKEMSENNRAKENEKTGAPLLLSGFIANLLIAYFANKSLMKEEKLG